MPTTTGVATTFIDFTRASNATVTDSDGRVKWAPHNLLTNSESFASSPWATYNATIASNFDVAPNGTTTADRFTIGGVAPSVYVLNGILAGQHTLAFFAKAGTSSTAGISVGALGNGQLATFNMSTLATSITALGTGGTVSGGTASITAVGNGWFLCVFANAITTGTNNVGYSIEGTSGQTGLIWGAHLYRSDLGGMQPNTSAYPMYNPTTPKNLLGYTEDLTAAAYWTNVDTADVTTGVTNPRGLSGATLVYPTSSGTDRIIYKSSIVGGAVSTPYTLSVYAKANGINFLYFGTFGGGTAPTSLLAFFDLQNGTKTQTGGYFTSASITPVGDGWYRCTATANATLAGVYPIFGIANANNSSTVTASGTSGIYLWGAQLSDSASLDSYVPVYGAAVTSAAYYGPRRDFDGATLACKGLLVEEQRTNFFSISNTAAAGTGTTITASAATSPDGTTNAYRIAKTDATTPRYISRNTTSMTTVANRTYTVSAWFKYDGFNTTVSLEYNDSANWDLSWNAQFTVANTGVTVLSAAGCTQSVQNVGNDWYRAIVTFTAGPAPTITSNPVVLTRITGASGVTVLGYGGQIEENAAFPTSYIPTNGATATRNADVASVSTQAFPYSAAESTLVVSGALLSVGTPGFKTFATLSDGTANNRISMYCEASASLVRQLVSSGGALQSQISPGSVSANTNFKMGTAVAVNDAVAYLNGTAGTPDTVVSMPSAINVLYLGSNFAGGEPINGHIRQITYLPRRVSNAELVTRST